LTRHIENPINFDEFLSAARNLYDEIEPPMLDNYWGWISRKTFMSVGHSRFDRIMSGLIARNLPKIAHNEGDPSYSCDRILQPSGATPRFHFRMGLKWGGLSTAKTLHMAFYFAYASISI